MTGRRVQNGWTVQNCEEEDAETEGEEGRVELSLLFFNLGVQCYILSMDDSMSIQQFAEANAEINRRNEEADEEINKREAIKE